MVGVGYHRKLLCLHYVKIGCKVTILALVTFLYCLLFSEDKLKHQMNKYKMHTFISCVWVKDPHFKFLRPTAKYTLRKVREVGCN